MSWPPPDPTHRYPEPTPYAPSSRSAWQVVGIVLLVIAAIAGVAMVMAFILIAVELNSYGNNK
jgi:hypothetical protein